MVRQAELQRNVTEDQHAGHTQALTHTDINKYRYTHIRKHKHNNTLYKTPYNTHEASSVEDTYVYDLQTQLQNFLRNYSSSKHCTFTFKHFLYQCE